MRSLEQPTRKEKHIESMNWKIMYINALLISINYSIKLIFLHFMLLDHIFLLLPHPPHHSPPPYKHNFMLYFLLYKTWANKQKANKQTAKQDSSLAASKNIRDKPHFWVKQWKKICQVNWPKKQPGVAILISNKMDFKRKWIWWNKEGTTY